MSSRSRPARVGFLACFAVLVALGVGFFNDCLASLGLSVAALSQKAPVTSKAEPAAEAEVRVRIVVQGEQCRLDGAKELRSCDVVCGEQIPGAIVELAATAGAQRAVEGLRTCLQRRGAKVQVISE
ncbi:hypothetical protein [Nannocystis radixulma]|uniref:Ribosomal protein L7/L12 C-terminal domain-containing protein n=1 Tax=Nannocystis radixulma TaxID=2995305 RepID=A0ABT5AYJ5_9BACT|nr:hypothetical protein [Nannocystis radixulma]MDC0666912.1 hypothetical protein [Nannocystis radixulma]